MIEALNEYFPAELSFNILKFMQHPIASMIKDVITERDMGVLLDDDDNLYTYVWTVREFSLGFGKTIQLKSDDYDYEERLERIKCHEEEAIS